MKLNKKYLLAAVVGALALLYFMRRPAPQSAPAAVNNSPANVKYGDVYINNTSTPATPQAPNPIYQSFYATSPGIPDVNITFNSGRGGSGGQGYIPIFGLIPR